MAAIDTAMNKICFFSCLIFLFLIGNENIGRSFSEIAFWLCGKV